MTLRLRGSTSQYVDITASPNAGDATLTLPTTTGTIRTTSPSGVDGDYTVATGATISGSTNTITGFTNGSERFRVRNDGTFRVGTDSSNVEIAANSGLVINDGAIDLYQATSTASAAPFLISSDVGGTQVEKLRVTAGGLVGIGTNNPTATLQLFGDSSSSFRISKSGVLAYDHTFDGSSYTIANNNGSAGIPIIIGTKQSGGETLRILSNGNVGIGTDDTTSKLEINGTVRSNEGYTVYPPSNSNYAFATRNAANDQWTAFIEASGQATFAGNIVLSTSGSGIDFHNYGSGTNIDSNLLDDYEEGTFTPTLYGGTTAGTFTPASNHGGMYTKIGNIVHCQINVQGNLTGAAGQPRVGGLPFTAASGGSTTAGNSAYSTGSLQYWNLGGADFMGPLNQASTTYIYFHNYDGDSSGSATIANATGHNLHCCVTYRVA